MSQIAHAFRTAGYVSAQDRLCFIAAETLRQFPKDWAGTETAGRERVDPNTPKLKEIALSALVKNARNWDGAKDAVFSAVRNDATLLWALFEPYRAIAVQKLLTDVAAEMRADEMARRGAGGSVNDQSMSAPRLRQPDAGQKAVDRRVQDASRAGMDAAAQVARLSMLDTFKANGRSIGDLTPAEANAWAGSRERDARFVRLLTANLPPDLPIRKFRTGDDANALYEQAVKETVDA